MEEAEAGGRRFPRKKPIVRPQRNPIEWRANLTQIRTPEGRAVNGIDAREFSYGEIEGRRQCWDVFSFIKEVTPGFDDAYIVEIAPQIGIRETRRITGEYMLTEDDILNNRDFDDSIGVNGWPVEAHVAGDVNFLFPEWGSRGFNQIPYRIIVPQRVENLFVAGRCASMTHEGQSSARVTGSCFVMGQAAGTAADIILRDGTTPRAVDIARLQQRLETDGAYLGHDKCPCAPRNKRIRRQAGSIASVICAVDTASLAASAAFSRRASWFGDPVSAITSAKSTGRGAVAITTSMT
jgi:hypothetical protein